MSAIRAKLLGVSALVILLFSGCGISKIHPAYELPEQDIAEPVPSGQSRVVFFNASSYLRFGLDGTDKINVYVNSDPIATIPISGYVQLFLRPDTYSLKLKHWDVVMFEDSFELEVSLKETYVRVFCTTFGTKFEVVEALPDDFDEQFRPIVLLPDSSEE